MTYPDNEHETDMSKTGAINKLAFELNFIQARIEGDDDCDWDSYSEADKLFYRESVEWLLKHDELIRQAFLQLRSR